MRYPDDNRELWGAIYCVAVGCLHQMSEADSEAWEGWEEEAGEDEDIAKSLFSDTVLPVTKLLEHDKATFGFDLREYVLQVSPQSGYAHTALIVGMYGCHGSPVMLGLEQVHHSNQCGGSLGRTGHKRPRDKTAAVLVPSGPLSSASPVQPHSMQRVATLVVARVDPASFSAIRTRTRPRQPQQLGQAESKCKFELDTRAGIPRSMPAQRRCLLVVSRFALLLLKQLVQAW